MRNLLGINLNPSDVFSALTSLNQVASRLRRKRDARAVFPDVYAVITRRVAAEVAKGKDSMFLEPEWIGRLAGFFAVRYFESLLASLEGMTQPSTAWRLAYKFAAQGHTFPAQDALLGINAHINYDLAQGIYDNIVAAGATDDEPMIARYRHDHDAVNQILEASLPECLAVLANRYNCPVSRVILGSEHLQAGLFRVTLAMLKLWRDRVWTDVVSILAAKKEFEKSAVISRMNRDSGIIAGLICLASTIFEELHGTPRVALPPRAPLGPPNRPRPAGPNLLAPMLRAA